MTFAPALTWMHLFPATARYQCDDAPAWFRDLLGPFDAAGPSNVRIAFNQDIGRWAGPAAHEDGLVAINCRHVGIARLAAAGFGYARGFAAIPSLQAARWFIPIDSGPVSSAAFGLYSPTRLSARLKQAAIRTVARSGTPLWYHDQVWIAGRQKPPLEQMIEQALPQRPFRLALSAGAPEPARNRKASAAVLGLDGAPLAFAKISGSPLARRLLEHEASILASLQDRPAVRDGVPRLIASGDVEADFVLLQSAVSGSAAPPRLTRAHHDFLNTLISADIKPATATALVADLAPRIAAAGETAAHLVPALRRVLASLGGCLAPSTCVHGDFVPWNLRRRRQQLHSFDWEYGQIDGLPMVDQTHHQLQVGHLLKDWTLERADDELESLAAGQVRFTPGHAGAFQNIYLIDVLTRLAAEGYDGRDPMVLWTRSLLERRVGRLRTLEAAA